MKYVRVMDKDISNAIGRKFKIGEVNISDEWDPNATTLDTIKGIKFSTMVKFSQDNKIMK